MSKISTVNFTGASGTVYSFDVYALSTTFNPIGAVYVITKRTPKPGGGGDHTVIYIGHTGDLSSRFDDHHKANCFSRHYANCICIHVEADEDVRLDIESDLIAAYQPPCNG